MVDQTYRLDPRYINHHAHLPYGLGIGEVCTATEETLRLLQGLNAYLAREGFRPLEELMLGNTLSGAISGFLVKNIARASHSVEANEKVGGHPDLLPTGLYPGKTVQKGTEGIEVKTSIQPGGWQGHNAEDGWLMVFRYSMRRTDGDTDGLAFIEVLCAELQQADWSFSGRTGGSRRTPTASIAKSGVEKLRRNFLYRLPGAGVGRHREILART